MTLTEEQIEDLFRFCQKKYVHWYDLQIELVDHLAERIEEEMTVNGNLSFEAALQKVYAGFGLFGFAHVVQERSRALEKQAGRTWRRAVKAYFTWPKLAMTAAVFMMFYTIGTLLPPAWRAGLLLSVLLVGFVREIVLIRRFRRAEMKNLLLTKYTPATSFVSFLVNTQIFVTASESTIGLWPFALLGMAAFVLHSVLINLTRNVYGAARKLYPGAFATA